MKKIILLFCINFYLFLSCSTEQNNDNNIVSLPVPPSNLAGTVAPSTQINLSWTDNSTDETGFKIERKTATGNFAVVGNTTTNVTTFSDTGLTPITIYTYRVISYNTDGNSPTYSNEITLTTPLTDIEGNTYSVATICNQTWTTKNLNVSSYSDGTPIPQVTNSAQWANLTTGAWCYYQNNTSNGLIYGKLYNWYAVMGIYDTASLANPVLRKKLTPTGWHVPTDAEWTQLADCLGGETVAGGKMKSIGTIQAGTGLWENPNLAATNQSGFSGLPGGVYIYNDPTFGIKITGKWWSTTEVTTTVVKYRSLSYNDAGLDSFNYSKKNGLSVRCIRD